jgi:hypothetical protein
VSSEEWPGISRVGEPVLVSTSQGGSVQHRNLYHIHTTPIPSNALGYDWTQFFTSQFTGQRPFRGYHDGSKAIIECSPDDAPRLAETVDTAIAYANEKVRNIK